MGRWRFLIFGDVEACGLCPAFAADFTSASNLGHASGSKSRLANWGGVGLAFAGGIFFGDFMRALLPHIREEFITAFGRFVILWSKFEFGMAHKFSEATGIPLQKAIVLFFSSSGFAGHRDLLKAAIADNGFLQPPKELTEILSEAEAINVLRNELVHGQWMDVRGDDLCVSVAKPKSAMRTYVAHITLKTIDDAANDIVALTDRLHDAPVAPTSRPRKHSPKDAAD